MEREGKKGWQTKSYGSKPGGLTGPPSGRGTHDWGKNFGNELRDLSKMAYERLLEIAEEVGKHLSPQGIDLKINQIRKFLDETRQIEADLKAKKFSPDRVILLRPKLAYAAGRNPNVKDLMNVLDPAIQSAAASAENFKKLLRFIESIIAYHTFYGGKN